MVEPTIVQFYHFTTRLFDHLTIRRYHPIDNHMIHGTVELTGGSVDADGFMGPRRSRAGSMQTFTFGSKLECTLPFLFRVMKNRAQLYTVHDE